MTMLQQERYDKILQKLKKEKKVYVIELSEWLNVTPETIRRDLAWLEKEQKLRRVHGGAIRFLQTQQEQHFARKMNMQLEAKKRIGQAAAELVQDGDTIVIDVGTTTIHLAGAIKNVKDVTIVTNSLAGADRLNASLEEGRFAGKVILLGGELNPMQRSVAGAMTVQMLEKFYFDKAFISCGGLMENSVMDYDLNESIVSSVMVKQSSEAILLADQSKLGARSFQQICPLSAIDYVISDVETPEDWKALLEEYSIDWKNAMTVTG